MKIKKDSDIYFEQKTLTCCLLKGMTLKQIAQELNCAKSTVAYKTKKLYKTYSASDRYEFVINVFTKLITRYKNRIEDLKKELEEYRKIN